LEFVKNEHIKRLLNNNVGSWVTWTAILSILNFIINLLSFI